MSGFVQWDNVPSGDGSRAEFLQLKSGNTYKVRPLLDAYNFHKYFHKVEGQKMRTAIVTEETVGLMAAKYPSELNKPANRYAMYVIDRNDGNKIKIMEFPFSIYKAFCNSFDATKKMPSHKTDGSDWLIKKSGVGLNTSYETTFVTNTPLTDEEFANLKEVTGGDREKIATIFPFCSLEVAEKKLFNPDEEGSGQIDASGSPAPVAAAPAPSPADQSPAAQDVAATTESSEDFDPDW